MLNGLAGCAGFIIGFILFSHVRYAVHVVVAVVDSEIVTLSQEFVKLLRKLELQLATFIVCAFECDHEGAWLKRGLFNSICEVDEFQTLVGQKEEKFLLVKPSSAMTSDQALVLFESGF
jgi:hypothetical protein